MSKAPRQSFLVTSFLSWFKRFTKSVWLFPAVLTILLLLLTVLKISGSSIGAYQAFFYGNTPDSHLVAGTPRPIRSDEWLVTTQIIIAQSQNHYQQINKNVGKGEDVSVVVDAPYKDWSVVFKPQDLAFFIMPLDNAFALRWWLFAYLLVISCYFFVLTLMPGKKVLAAALSISLLFSAFVQWWYSNTTLGSLYYSLFIMTVAIAILKQHTRWKKILWGALLCYLLVCFALVLYPPFQIACGLVVIAFLAGYVLKNYREWPRKQLIENAVVISASGLVAIALVGIYMFTRIDTIKAVINTAYPGHRTIQSGEFYPIHFMSSHLGYQFTSDTLAAQYLINGKDPSNQSETSNFLLLAPFLLAPAAYLLYYDRRNKHALDWPLLFLSILFVLFLLELFVPAFTPFSKLLLLDKVGGSRALIGIGLLNLLLFVTLIRNYGKKKFQFPPALAIGYCVLILFVELALSLYAHNSFGTFISLKRAVLFSIPIPIIIYLFLTKRFLLAVLGYTLFSVFISFGVNPLYRGLETITQNPLTRSIASIGGNSNKAWVGDGGYLENIATISGEHSITGVYNYPQFKLWSGIPGAKQNTYNRYAHVGFQISDNPATKTRLSLVGADSFVVTTSSCSPYLHNLNVGFIVTSEVLKSTCLSLEKTVTYPARTVYIYKID